MRVIIHSSIALCTPSRAILYDEAEKYAREGHEVYFLYCDQLMDLCLTNPNGSHADCRMCVLNYTYEKRKLSKKINFVSLRNFYLQQDLNVNDSRVVPCYNSLEDIKKIKYKDVAIGLSSLSTYISITRNLSPLIDAKFKAYFNKLLLSSIKLVEAVDHLIKNICPDLILLYNGRLSDSRPIWELAKTHSVDFYAYECIIGLGRMYKSVFYNTISHMIDARTKKIYEFWNNDNISLCEKKYYGTLFFNKRRQALPAADKVFTEHQKLGLLPITWNNLVRNIVIYISSEDEFAAVWDDMSEYSLFKSQIDGIKYILNQFKDNDLFNFYIRIHPNLSNVKYKYHRELLAFEKSNNVFVIQADSPVSSYTLLDHAEKVIVFGSTIGIEAVYWGKPTLLLGPADYYYLDACYIPKRKEDIYRLVSEYLKPKDISSAIKYGYFLINNTWPSNHYIDFSTEETKIEFGAYSRVLYLNNWLKILGSRRLYIICRYAIHKLFKIRYRNQGEIFIPLNEL